MDNSPLIKPSNTQKQNTTYKLLMILEWFFFTKSDFVSINHQASCFSTKLTCSNIPAAPEYISQFLGYSRACGSYHGFLSANREAIDTGHRVPSG